MNWNLERRLPVGCGQSVGQAGQVAGGLSHRKSWSLRWMCPWKAAGGQGSHTGSMALWQWRQAWVH